MNRITIIIIWLIFPGVLDCAAVAESSPCEFEIRGVVCEEESGLPIANVFVRKSADPRLAATDTLGRFTLSVNCVYVDTLTFTHLSYESRQVVLSSSPQDTIVFVDTLFLRIKPRVIEGITVRAKRDVPFRRPSINVDRYTAVELAEFPGSFNDPSRFVRILPGVQTSNDFRSDLVVRGGNPVEAGVLLDGFVIPNLNHFGQQGSTGGPFGMLSARDVAELHFSPGGFSVKYPNRLSSMLEYKTVKPRDYDHRFRAQLELTGFSLSGAESSETTYGAVTVRRGFYDAVKDQLNLPSAPRFTDMLTRFGIKLTDNQILSSTGLFAVDRFSLPAGELPYDDGSLDYDQNQAFWGIRLLSLESSRSSAELSYSFVYNDYDIGYSQHRVKDVFLNESYERTHRFAFNYSTESESGIWWNSGLNFTHSADSYNIGIVDYVDEFGVPRLGTKLDSRLDINASGVYAEAIARPVEPVEVTAGIRHDYNFLLDRGLISPRFHVKCELLQGLSATAGYGLFGQAPSNLWLASDPSNYDLPFFRATHLTAGARWMPSDNISLRVEAYYKDYLNYPVSYTDSIRTMVDWGTDFRFYDTRKVTADGSGYARGIEITLQGRLRDAINYVLGGSLSKSRYSGIAGHEVDGDFDTRYSLGASVSYSPLRWLQFGLQYSRKGGEPYTPVDELVSYLRRYTFFDHSRINEAFYPPYHRLDLRVSTSWAIGSVHMEVFGDLLNVYDRENVYLYYWDSDAARVESYKQWNRLAVFGIGVQF